MVDGDKHRDLPLARDGRGQVRAPHRVHRLGDDGAVVVARASGGPSPGGREEVVLAHEPQDATLGRAEACHAQPGPDLPGSLAVKRAGGQDRADRLDQGRIRHRPNRARTPRHLGPGGGEMAIDRGARRTPDPAHAGQAIGPATCGRDGPAHRRDLRRAKGRLASRAAILASSNSRSSSISPSLALSRSVSSASPSVDRVARLASPAATKVSCHPLRVAAVTPSARESISRSSPRNRRNTASRLRLRDIRPPRPRPIPVRSVVSLVIVVTLLRIRSAYRVSQRTVERSTIEQLEETTAAFDARIEAALAPFRDTVERLTQVPGLSTRAAEVVIAEIGLDMSRFPTAGHLLSWAGLVPALDESAGKRRSTRVTKGA